MPDRQRRPLRDILGAYAFGQRPGDAEIRTRVGQAGKASFKWLAGGGLGVYLSLTMIDFGKEWVRQTWKQTDALTQKLDVLVEKLGEVAEGQRDVVERIDRLTTVQAAPPVSPKPVKVRPVRPAP